MWTRGWHMFVVVVVVAVVCVCLRVCVCVLQGAAASNGHTG